MTASNHYQIITDQPLSVTDAFSFIQSPVAGGQVLFTGTIRNHHEGKTVLSLEYHLFGDMAEKEITRIIAEANSRWPLTRVYVAHKTGHCNIGDLAVIVAVSSVHRSEAFEASRFLIDEIKHRVPIWKKETTTEGVFWVEGCNHVHSGSDHGTQKK